jgi:putative hemolysin
MEINDSSEPPGKSKRARGIAAIFKKFMKSPSEAETLFQKNDELIEKSIDELSSSIASNDESLEDEAREMIHGVLDITSTSVKEIMVPRIDIIGVESGATIQDVIELVKKHGHSRMPLYEESLDNILGVLYVKDVFVQGMSPWDIVDKSKTRETYFVPENMKVSDLLRDIQAKKIHLAVVVDEYGGTAGLVTLEDILEEIVGEIEDEYDSDSPLIKKIDDRHFAVKGSLAIYELNEELDLELPEDQFETVAGVIYDIVGSLPAQGTAVSYKGLKFTADKIEGQRITRVIVELPSVKPPQVKESN